MNPWKQKQLLEKIQGTDEETEKKTDDGGRDG